MHYNYLKKIDSEKFGAQWSKEDDNRITNIGKFIRSTRIDELPQLINVIKGDLSLIGPRPEREIFEKELRNKINHYSHRYLIKPGLSGWAQVNYPYGSSFLDSKIKLSYDLYYIRNYSLTLDILIFFKTIQTILNLNKFNKDYPVKFKMIKKDKADVLKTHGDNKKIIKSISHIKFSDFDRKFMDTFEWYKKNKIYKL